MVVMVKLHCQLDWILSRLGDTILATPETISMED